MADFQISKSKKKRREQDAAPRLQFTHVDLTPMVDLAFLLITFFMLSTVLSKPQVMPVVMPKADKFTVPTHKKASQVLTLLLGKGDGVYHYEGIENVHLDSTNYAAHGLRRVILDKKRRVQQEWGLLSKPIPGKPGLHQTYSYLTVLIKPSQDAVYKNVVDALDEMKICGIDYYVLLDISPQELAFMADPAMGLQFTAEQQAAVIAH